MVLCFFFSNHVCPLNTTCGFFFRQKKSNFFFHVTFLFVQLFAAPQPLPWNPATNDSINKPGATCFVFYLPPSVTKEQLHQLFVRFGTVLNAHVAMDKQTGRSKGYGFVDFAKDEEARNAVVAMDKYQLENKFLSVSIKI